MKAKIPRSMKIKLEHFVSFIFFGKHFCNNNASIQYKTLMMHVLTHVLIIASHYILSTYMYMYMCVSVH